MRTRRTLSRRSGWTKAGARPPFGPEAGSVRGPGAASKGGWASPPGWAAAGDGHHVADRGTVGAWSLRPSDRPANSRRCPHQGRPRVLRPQRLLGSPGCGWRLALPDRGVRPPDPDELHRRVRVQSHHCREVARPLSVGGGRHHPPLGALSSLGRQPCERSKGAHPSAGGRRHRAVGRPPGHLTDAHGRRQLPGADLFAVADCDGPRPPPRR
ncbi:hypothetical protein ABIB14_001277 [Arthrobacter sp. UYEF3]